LKQHTKKRNGPFEGSEPQRLAQRGIDRTTVLHNNMHSHVYKR